MRSRSAPRVIFTLSYINLESRERHYDKEFRTMAALRAFVAQKQPEWTSYQIIVVRAQ